MAVGDRDEFHLEKIDITSINGGLYNGKNLYVDQFFSTDDRWC